MLEVDADLDALFVWSTFHGIANILEWGTVHTMDLGAETLSAAPAHILESIGVVMGCNYAVETAKNPSGAGAE